MGHEATKFNLSFLSRIFGKQKNVAPSFFSCPNFLVKKCLTFIFFLSRIFGATRWDIKQKQFTPLFLSRIFGKQKMSPLHSFLVQDFW